MQWLAETNFFNKVYQIRERKVSMRAYENSQYFKIYFCDVGLLNTMTNLLLNTLIHVHHLFQELHGVLGENVVAQELMLSYDRLNYWNSENRAEADFVF